MALDNARTRTRTHTDNCGPPPRHPTDDRDATRRGRPARGEKRSRVTQPRRRPPAARRTSRPHPASLEDVGCESFAALGLMSAGVLIKLPRHPAPPPSTFGGACAYLLMQRAKRQNHPGARRFPSFPYRAVPININPPHGVSPTFEPERDLPWIDLVKRRAGGGLSARTAARSSSARADGRARRRWRVWPRS